MLEEERDSDGYLAVKSFFIAKKSTSLTLTGGKSAQARSNREGSLGRNC